MNLKQQTSLGALQFKPIDGLQIRFATNDRKAASRFFS